VVPLPRLDSRLRRAFITSKYFIYEEKILKTLKNSLNKVNHYKTPELPA